MMAFDSRQLPLPLNPRLSRPFISLPSDSILHHHSHFTGCALNYFPHLPSNAQGQNCHLLHHVRLKIPRGQSAHLLKHWKHTAQWRETRINQDCRTPEPPQFATICLKTGTQNQKGPKRNGTVRENKIGEPRSGPFGPRIGFSKPQIHNTHALNSQQTPTPPRRRRHKHYQTCPSANADATGDFLFLVLPSPKKGAGWGGGAQQQQQKSAAAIAAAARARGNKINTTMRSNALLACRLVVF